MQTNERKIQLAIIAGNPLTLVAKYAVLCKLPRTSYNSKCIIKLVHASEKLVVIEKIEKRNVLRSESLFESKCGGWFGG